MPSARRWPVWAKRRFSSLAARLASPLGGGGDAAGDHGGRELAVGALADHRVGDARRSPADRGVGVAAQRIVDDPGQRPDRVLAGDAHAPQRDPGEVVDGPVERVHDPSQARAPLAVGGALLAEDPVVGPAAGEHRGDRGLRCPIGVRDEVGRVRLGAQALGRAPVAGGQLGARAERRLPGDVEDVAGHDGRARGVPVFLHASDFTTQPR